jgi:hypothetical protein
MRIRGGPEWAASFFGERGPAFRDSVRIGPRPDVTPVQPYKPVAIRVKRKSVEPVGTHSTGSKPLKEPGGQHTGLIREASIHTPTRVVVVGPWKSTGYAKCPCVRNTRARDNLTTTSSICNDIDFNST